MNKLATQEYIARLEALNTDLQMRNGELSNALKQCDQDAWESLTPERIVTGGFRVNRIEKVITAALIWRKICGYALGSHEIEDALCEAIERLDEYLSEWQRDQLESRERAEKSARARKTN